MDYRKKLNRSIKHRIIRHYMLVILVTLSLAGTVFFIFVHTYYYDGIEKTLINHGNSATSIVKSLNISNQQTLQKHVPELIAILKHEDSEVQIIDENNNILLSSSEFLNKEPQLTTDVQGALGGERTTWKGISSTGESSLAVSTPLIIDEKTIGALRYVTSLEHVDKLVTSVYTTAILVGGIILISVFLFTLTLANSISRPIQAITAASTRMMRGQFDTKLSEHYEGEIGTLAKSLNKMADEIVKSDQLKNEFISSVSHELRTPLTSIKGWSETMLLDELNDKEETTLAFQIISSETNRLISLVEELLDFSHFQAGKIKLSFSTVEIGGVIQQLTSQYRLKAEKNGITLNCEVHSTPFIVADKNRIKQVLTNLIDNAIKYSPKGTTISLLLAENKYNVIIQVIDEGIGISPQHIPHIKQTFYQVDANRDGTGLGLAIVDNIVQLHNGTLHIESNNGQGTSVTVTLQKKQEEFPSYEIETHGTH